jgi:hypothetical protein
MRTLTLALMALALGACNTVEFENPPALPLNACAEGWPGDWRVVVLDEAETETGGESFVRIAADCRRWQMISFEASGEVEIDELLKDSEIGFAASESHQVLAIRSRPETEPSPDAARPNKPDGWWLMKWSRDDASITLQQADLRRAAHLVIDGKTPGWVEKFDRRPDGTPRTGGPQFWVYLFGTPADMARLLDAHDLYAAISHRLEPATPGQRARIDAALAAAAYDATQPMP